MGISAPESSKAPQGTDQSLGLVDPAPDFTPQTVYAAFPAEMQLKFEQSVAQAFNSATDKAGISVGVYQGDRLWSYATGTASESVPMRVETPMLIRSVSKTFIAALIVSQVEDGLYKLSDSILSVLSDHPDYGDIDTNTINPDVTVSQLLSMTTGLADYGENKGSDYRAVQASPDWKPADLLRLISSPHSSPGQYAYSNTNTTLLGMIAEHHGGLPLNRLLKQEFFDPLGISAGLLPQDGIPGNTARPHGDREQWGGVGFGDISESSSGWQQDWYLQTNRTTWIGGGIVTTAGNLARWGYDLFSERGTAIAPKVRETLLDSFLGETVRIGGTLQQYGFHVTKSTLELEDGSNLVVYGHPGSGGGFTALLLYSPQLDLSISVLANSHTNVRGVGPEITALSSATIRTIMRAISLTYLQDKGAATVSRDAGKGQGYTEKQDDPDDSMLTESVFGTDLTGCSNKATKFDAPPVPLAQLVHIEPMGKMGGTSGHITPTDHLYIRATSTGPKSIPVQAIADGYLVKITRMPDREGLPDWRAIIEHSCSVFSWYIHLDSFSEAILQQITIPPDRPWHGRIPLKSGEPVGHVGELLSYQQGFDVDADDFDWAVTDTTTVLPGFVIPDHYSGEAWKIHSVDPFDYYDDPLQSALRQMSLRTAEPVGGKIDFDIDGRLVGNWFLDGTRDYFATGLIEAGESAWAKILGVDPGDCKTPVWDNELRRDIGYTPCAYWLGHAVFAYDYIDPNIVLISLGRHYDGAEGVWTPWMVLNNGPDPAQVSVDTGQVKYELVNSGLEQGSLNRSGVPSGGAAQTVGTLLVEMLDDRSIKVELFAGVDVSMVVDFTDKARIYRR